MLASTRETVTTALDGYEPLDAATALAGLVDDLSNWYVRRSRRRFWRTDPDAPAGDTLAAQATLHEVLTTLSLLLAPFCPFVADSMWRALTGVDETESVHLADWPEPQESLIDRDLEAQMELARRLTSLGRAARSEAGVKVRQPLARALVFLPSDAPAILYDMVAEELNVDEIDVADELSEVLEFELVPNFRTLGPRLGEQVKDLKPALAKIDGAVAAAALEAGQSIALALPGGPVELSPEDVQLRVRGQQGFAVSREGGEVVALDLKLNDSLRHRGLAREVVRLLQDLRKNSGLDVSDRIHLQLDGLNVIEGYFDYIGREVLALSISQGPGQGEGTALELETDEGGIDARAWLRKADADADGRRRGIAEAEGSALAVARGAVKEFFQSHRECGSIRRVERCEEVAIDPVDMLADGLTEGRFPGRGEHHVHTPAIRGAVLPGDQAGLDHPVHQAGDPARGERHLRAQPAHGQTASVGASHMDEDVEPDQRYADGTLELTPQHVGQSAVRAHQQTHELEPLVLDLIEDTAGAALGDGYFLHLAFTLLGEFHGAHRCSSILLDSTRNRRLPD